MKELEVSVLNEQLKSLIESTFLQVCVVGEVSRPTYHSSGHLYFTLKDSKATIKCVMFRGNNTKMKFKIEDGMRIVVFGGVSVYVPNGSYQIVCSKITLEGQGDLLQAYEQLKKELEQKGYFDSLQKKPLPQIPQKIALITSKTGAALQDMLRVARNRWRLVEVSLFDTLVQGELAPMQIAHTIAQADVRGFDVLIIARGGGSLEDLWAFNDVRVCEAIYNARTPLVSAVGHEIDFMLSDFVADMRAATPSNAMEIVLPDCNEWKMSIDLLSDHAKKTLEHTFSKKAQSIEYLLEQYRYNSVKSKINYLGEHLGGLEKNFSLVFLQNLKRQEMHLQMLVQNYEALKPTKQLRDSFVQITKDGKKTNLQKVRVQDSVKLEDGKFIVEAKIESKLEAKSL